ncbi:alpha/beta fold hydrolase [Streptomyces sp. NPDC051921]|uniref:thioesterase II family protein n=1 Tax=Streptomyces sp. NPDC051921 TaxID=3155806 RepID=UPI00343ECC65
MTGLSTQSSAWVRRFHRKDAPETRLICFPHAGGSATYFFPVSQGMPSSVEVLALQYPGRQERRTEPCVEDLHVLADLVHEELRPWVDRPFALFGHSMGASLAFEVARRLEADGIVPQAVFASGRRAPSRFRDERVHLMDDATLIADLKRLAGTDPRMLGEEEVLRMILPALRSDYTAAETYRVRPGRKLAAPVLVFTGADDPQVTLDEANAWSEHTTAEFRLRVLPGGHFFLNDHGAELMKEFTAVLARA